MSLVLYVGSKRYSSWSLRPYLALVHAAPAGSFDVRTILLDQPETKAEIASVTQSGRVPALHHDGVQIWDSLAICEYLAELYPAVTLWPRDRATRARARSLSAEMHAGFVSMRRNMAMDIGASHPGEGHTPQALVDARRVMAIWRGEIAASGGPFLFGAFTIADAMFAPVTTRFVTYGVDLDATCRSYVGAIAGLPAMQAWTRDAVAEPVTRSE